MENNTAPSAASSAVNSGMTDEQDPHSLKDTVLAHYSQKRRRQPSFSDPLPQNATESSDNHEDHAVDAEMAVVLNSIEVIAPSYREDGPNVIYSDEDPCFSGAQLGIHMEPMAEVLREVGERRAHDRESEWIDLLEDIISSISDKVYEDELERLTKKVVYKPWKRTQKCRKIVETLCTAVYSAKELKLAKLLLRETRTEGPELRINFELSSIKVRSPKKPEKRMYGAVAMDPFSNVLVGVVYHQDKGLPWMQMNTKKLAKLAKTTTSTESFYGSQSGYTRQAFDDLQADQFVVDFDEDTRITFLMVPMEVVQTLKEISRQMTYARIFGPEQHQTREEEQRFLEDRALRTSGAYLQERLENDFKNAMWKSHTKAHVEKLSKEVLAIAPTSYLRITCRKKYVQRLAEKVSEHIWTKISMDRLMVIVNSIQRADVDRLVHGVFHQMLTETVSDEAIIQTTHATLNESIEYDIIYGLYSCSFERESLALNFYREIFLDIFKEQALETLLSMQASWLFDEIQRQLAMLRVGLPMPMAYNSKAYVNRYWLSSMAHQIAQSLLIAEQMTDRQLTLAYKQTMEKEMRKKQGEELLKEGVEKIVRSHAKKAWKEERTKELAKLHVQFHNQCYFEYFCLLNNVISELGGKAIASAMDHHTLYVKTVKKMMEEEVDVERRKWQMHYGNIVADVAIDLLDTSFEFFVGIIAQRVSISPDPTVKPNLDDLAHIFACDLQITDSQRPVSLQTLACRKKLIKVCFDNRCKAVERHNARSIFQKRAADRVDRCWEKLHWHFIRQKLMKADPKNNSFDIFVMNTMSQVATRIMRDQKFEILRHRNVPPFIKHVSMCIYGELIVTCGADESFQNLKKQYPGEQLKHLFRRNWDRAVQEEPDACQDFINWVKGLIKTQRDPETSDTPVAKRMKRLLDGSRFTDGSNIETVMRFRLRRLQELYLNMKFSEQDMKLPFVRTLVARSMAVNGSLRKRSFDEMSSGKDERFKLSDWETDSSSCSSSETEISSSESEESSSESESVQSDQESP